MTIFRVEEVRAPRFVLVTHILWWTVPWFSVLFSLHEDRTQYYLRSRTEWSCFNVCWGNADGPGPENLSEPILSRLERARPSVARAAFVEICMNERERLPERELSRYPWIPPLASERYVSRIRLCSWRDISAFNMGIRALAMERGVGRRGEGDKWSVCSDFNDTERHGSGFWLMVLRLHATPTFQRRTCVSLRHPTPLCPVGRIFFSLFQHTGTILTSVSDSRPSCLFSSSFPATPPLSHFSFLRGSSPSFSFICWPSQNRQITLLIGCNVKYETLY